MVNEQQADGSVPYYPSVIPDDLVASHLSQAKVCHTGQELSAWHMLHRSWTECVNKPVCDKEAWRKLEIQLKVAGVIR